MRSRGRLRSAFDHIEFFLMALVVVVVLAIAVAACGEDELPENCYRDDGEVVCVNQGGDDGEREFDEED